MGNRGCLHDDQGQLTSKRWAHQSWVACKLEFNGWKRELMTPTYYTELFFTDEAVALSAGHRPCGTCRHSDYRRFQDAVGVAFPELGKRPAPSAMDKLLHRNRVDGRSKKQITFEAPLSDLPSGVFFTLSVGGRPILRRDNGYSAWSFEGYEDVDCNSSQTVTVLTPKPIVEAIKSGYKIS
jgi:hypothetical protein